MRRRLVRGGGVQRSVNLDQNEACRIISLLKQVKARDARLLNAAPRVFGAACGEGRNELLEALIAKMPMREPEFDEDQVTDYYEREIAATNSAFT